MSNIEPISNATVVVVVARDVLVDGRAVVKLVDGTEDPGDPDVVSGRPWGLVGPTSTHHQGEGHQKTAPAHFDLLGENMQAQRPEDIRCSSAREAEEASLCGCQAISSRGSISIFASSRKMSTTWGSNWLPALLRISLTA